jgi:PAS domain S-box-containing protein
VLVVVGMMHYYTVYATERSGRESSETLNVGLARRMINADISAVLSDLRFLVEHIQRQHVFEMSPQQLARLIGLEFQVFAEKKRLYDQIRFLDENGLEVVRVNFNGGNPRILPDEELQNKRNRYYFQQAIELSEGASYISPLDLNVEGGQIEYPLKPMMRFATPIFDRNGVKRGIILLNYLGERLIQNFTHAAANIADHTELVNQEGYWLSSPNPEDAWGFMLGRNTTFGKRYPAAWRIISSQQQGQFANPEGLFTFHTVHPVNSAASSDLPLLDQPLKFQSTSSRIWKIISRIPPSDIYSSLPGFLRQHLALYLAMFLLISFGSALLAYSHLRHRRAEAQSEYEKRFRHTLENIELAAVTLDRQGHIRFCNKHFLGLTGWNQNELVGSSWIERFVPKDATDQITDVLSAMGDPQEFPTLTETQVKTRNGELRLIAWNNTLSYNTEGEVIGVTGIGEDITEKRHAEEELHKLFQAVEQSPSIVMITNPMGEIEYVNPKFTEVTGYPAAEVMGQNPSVLKSGETSSDEYHSLWDAISDGGEWRGEFHNRRKNGELYWESAAISAIHNAAGEITHYLAVKEDITERKRLEAEVAERNRELAHAQTLAAMGRMASMIAHDLRNPLSSVKMTLQILGKQSGDNSDDSKESELRQIALDQIRYMEEILSDMLTYSRPDAIKPQWLSVEKIIDTAIGLAQKKIDTFKVDLHTFYQPGMPTVYADPNKLRQVFSNLIVNAAQATSCAEKPQIIIEVMIELGPRGTGLRIDICDNGCGIDPKIAAKLFDPFYTSRAQGTGLGLAIVKRIIEQHKGSIMLHNNEPQGACASIVLPTSFQSPEHSGDSQLEEEER